MAKQVKMQFTLNASGTRTYLEKLAADLEAVAVPGASSGTGKPVYTVTLKRVTIEEADL